MSGFEPAPWNSNDWHELKENLRKANEEADRLPCGRTCLFVSLIRQKLNEVQAQEIGKVIRVKP